MGSDSQDIQQHIGCGADINLSQITLNINTTTGGCFSVSVDSHTTVENLKKIVAKKLKVAKDRICLLHREKELHDGTSIKENGIMDGSKIILLPNVETGLLAQRPENTVMQALESLNDSQVNDFLSGKTPLNLSMRLGDHMMLIQLQLSTVNPTNSASSASSSTATSSSSNGSANANHPSRTRGIIRSKTSSSVSSRTSMSQSPLAAATTSTPIKFTNSNQIYKSTSEQNVNGRQSPQPSTSRAALSSRQQSHNSINNSTQISPEDFDDLQNIVKSLVQNGNDESRNSNAANDTTSSDVEMENSIEQSPIKSLSNLVSGPIKTTPMNNIPMSSPTNACTDPINAKLTSCLCKTLETPSTSTKGCDTNCQFLRNRQQQQLQQQQSQKKLPNGQPELKDTNFFRRTPIPRSAALLHRTLNNPITKTKSASASNQQMVHVHRVSAAANVPNLRRSKSTENITISEQGIAKMVAAKTLNNELAVDQPISIIDTTAGGSIDLNTTDTLAEASRNLTKTLRKLSKEVFTNKSEASTFAASEDGKRARTTGNNATASGTGSHSSSAVSSVTGIGSGAVIESMRNHGRGIYSGTFSGTLNPALQDRYGRPKRDISTVIHILNDLLSATPHYSRGARISFEPAHNSRSSKYSSSKRTTSSSHSQAAHQHQREQCSKCVPSTSKSFVECSSDCSKTTTFRRISSVGRHTYVTTETPSKPASMPSTPVSQTQIDCRQCQMRLSSSAPVTPTVKSPNQSIGLNESMESTSSNSSLDVSANSSAFDFRNSSNDPLMCSPAATSAQTHPICTKCSNMELENSKTKTKLDQLRLVMQQRRERREARKMRPYGGRIIGASATATTTATLTNPTNSTDSTNNASVIQTGPPSNPIVEQVDTLA